jgi:transposase
MFECSKCGNQINTDSQPECYRPELDYKCICQQCWEKMSDADIKEIKGESLNQGTYNCPVCGLDTPHKH